MRGSRRRVSGCFALLPAALLLVSLWGGPAAGAEKVSLALNWLPAGIHVPLFFAREGGYWSRAGLEVSFEPSRGSADALGKLALRKVHFALAETAALIEARSGGQPLVGVFLLFDRGPSAILALERSGVRSFKDLAGRTLGAPRASFPRLLFPELARAAGVDLGRVKRKDLPAGDLLPSLLAGEVDGVASYTTVAPQYELAARKAGQKLLVLPYLGLGVEIYGLSLITSDQVVADQADLVRRFVGGMAEGLREALLRPAEALKVFLEKNPPLEGERAAGEWREAMKLIDTPRARRLGLGRFDGKEMTAFYRLLAQRRNLKPIGNVEELFTNRFAPGPR